ncbi:MAG: hypothetical protein AB7D02_01935 [Candidatus Paceibacterota bacterium]
MRHFSSRDGSLKDPLSKKIELKPFLGILFGLSIFFIGITPLGTSVEGSLTENTLSSTFKEYHSQNSLEFLNTVEKVFLVPALPDVMQEPNYLRVIVTGYSSTPEETDDTPFITASGKVVEEGIIAANFLPFGTKVRFPLLFPDKIFIVEDRMHSRFSKNRVDIWFPSKELALQFGAKETLLEIIK